MKSLILLSRNFHSDDRKIRSNKTEKIDRYAISLVAFFLATSPANSQTVWYGVNSNDWFDGTNWNAGVPVSGVTDTYISAEDPNNQPVIDGTTGATNKIYVGFDGTSATYGVLTIQNGGVLNATSSGFIGYSDNTDSGDASVVVTGAGSQWNMNSGTLTIGHSDNGLLTINDGGSVISTYGTLGFASGVHGTVNIWDVGSKWAVDDRLRVGVRGSGALTISAGAMVTSKSGGLGLVGNSSAGDVIVAGVGSRWTVDDDIDLGFEGKGTLTVSYGGAVEIVSGVGAINVATITGSEGILIVGGASGTTAEQAGTLNVPRIAFGGGDGTLVFNHTDIGYTLNADIDGNGAILHEAGETIYNGMGGLFSGSTDLSGGSLLVDGFLGGLTTINGGTLGGDGALVDFVANNGGTLAPGNSIGSLDANSATFNVGSIFEVEMNDGGSAPGVNNDFLDVTNGAGYLEINGGTIHVTPENGTDDGSTYTPGLYYTIIESNDRIGEFDMVTDDFPLLTFTDLYVGGNVLLTSAVATDCPAGLTYNQHNTCGGVMSVGSGSMFDAVINLSSAELPSALDLLSGEIHASTKGVLIEQSRFPREAANERIRATFSQLDKKQTTSSTQQQSSLWGQVYGASAQWLGDGNAAKINSEIGGVLVGADGVISNDLTLGILAGYNHSNVAINERKSSAELDSWQLGIYAGKSWDGFQLQGGLIQSWHDISSNRNVSFRGFSDQLSANYDAQVGQIFVETSYELGNENFDLEPYLGLAHIRQSTQGFVEQGGNAALTSSTSSFNTTFTTLGVRLNSDVVLFDEISAELSGGLGLRHALGDLTPKVLHEFSGGDRFNIAGVPMGRNTLMLDLGADIALGSGANLGIAYSGLLAGNLVDHSVKVDLSVDF